MVTLGDLVERIEEWRRDRKPFDAPSTSHRCHLGAVSYAETRSRPLPGQPALLGARALGDNSGLLFPSVTGRRLPRGSIWQLLRDLGIPAVPHGFRSSFRDSAAECSDARREVCELALAHVNSDRVEAAYRRTDLFEKRRQLMEQWATFLAGTGDNAARLSG